MLGAAVTTLGAVVSSDGVTLVTGRFTLGAGPFLIIFVRSSNIFACFSLISVNFDKVSFTASISSSAAMIVLSCSEIVGILQCVGNNFVELAIHVVLVVGIQNCWHL